MTKVVETDFRDWEEATRRRNELGKVLHERVLELLDMAIQTLDVKKYHEYEAGDLDWWYGSVDDRPYRGKGEFDAWLDQVGVNVEWQWGRTSDQWSEFLDVKFLWMDDAEVKQEYAKIAEAQRKKNELDKANEDAQRDLRAKAVAKLTPEEKRALRIF